jgi:hypothetical protein
MGVTRPLAEAMWGGGGALKHYQAYNRAVLGSLTDIWPAITFGMTAEFPVEQFNQLTKARPELQKVLLDLGNNKWLDHTPGAIPGAYGRVVRTYGFSPLGAADIVFKMVPYRYSVNLQTAQGVSVDYVKAVEMGEFETFQAEIKGKLGMLAQLGVDYPALTFIMPFVKTLINLIRTSIDYTPILGQAKNLNDLLGNKGNDARRLALAQGVVGTAIATIAVLLHGGGDDDEESLLSSTGPVNFNKQALFQANHEKLGLRIGDVVLPLWRFEPLASVLGLSIAASQASKMDGEAARKHIVSALLQVVIGKSFMVGPAEAIDAAVNYETVGENYFTKRLPQSIATALVVPNFVNQMGDFTDEYKREALTWSDAFQKKVPGLREQLNPALDYAGRPIRETRYGNPTPLQLTEKRNDPLASVLLGNNIPLDRAPRSLKGMPYEDRKELLQQRKADLDYLVELAADPRDKGLLKQEADRIKSRWGGAVSDRKAGLADLAQ